MSSNSSRPDAKQRLAVFFKALFVAIAAPAWTVVAVFGIGALIATTVLYSGTSQLGLTLDDSAAFTQMLLGAMVYLVGSYVLLIEPYAVRRMSIAQIRELVGLGRRPILKDLGFGLLAWAFYMVTAIVVTVLIAQFVPMVNLDQEQDVGFESLTNSLDIFYAFLVIVIAAPLVEELAFRGYLYGTLKPYLRWVLASLITSLLFGLVHGQLNVGIDTFLMSMVVCYLRDRTGSIWAGIVVHALKNAIAFYILFVAPDWLMKLIIGV